MLGYVIICGLSRENYPVYEILSTFSGQSLRQVFLDLDFCKVWFHVKFELFTYLKKFKLSMWFGIGDKDSMASLTKRVVMNPSQQNSNTFD